MKEKVAGNITVTTTTMNASFLLEVLEILLNLFILP